MKIDIVIPNYNGADLVEKNLPFILAEVKKYDVDKVIITDDRSRDEDFKKLERVVDNLKKSTSTALILIRNEKNLGFSSNVNNGVKISNADYVVLLNTDVIPEKNFLDAALKDLENDKEIFGVGMMDKSIEGEQVILRGRGVAYWSRGFLIHSRGEIDKNDTFWISGGSSIVRRAVFEKLSGFDPLYNPFYWEDIDLSYRARKAGYKLKFENKSIVEHRHDEGAIKKHYKSHKIKTIAYRNQFTFVWKNITDMNLIVDHLLWMPYYFIKSLINLDSAFFIGFCKAFLRFPSILSARKKQAKIYKKRDAELLK